MKIYIASSWKNQHAVELLTDQLIRSGHTVFSFVENSYNENLALGHQDFEKWVKGPLADKAFAFDTTGATTSDLVIYIGPSGKDAAAEVGAAWAAGVPIYGLWAKGEDFGLMRRMVDWFERVEDLLKAIG